MARYQCSVCGYEYDEGKEGKRWSDLPDDWACPVCGAAKSQFQRMEAETPAIEAAVDTAAVEPVAETSRGITSRAVATHRVFGYVFVAVYLLLMWQMVPRLWSYQIEFPARTVVHITLGMAIGAILVLKIIIVRFFRRLEASLVPLLGTSLLVGSVVLIGISAPFAFHEALATRTLFAGENSDRVRSLLAQAGWSGEDCARFASSASLREGQRVLRQRCIECHDLRTVLARPRTPGNWWQTVQRMANRTTALNPLSVEQQKQVTAYLVTVSPQLQQSAEDLRGQRELATQSKQAVSAAAAGDADAASYDAAQAKKTFETKCSQCHKADLVQDAPPASEAEARELVARMVENGLAATPSEIAQIVRYLTESGSAGR